MQAQQLIEFLGNHTLLAVAFVGISIGLAWTFIAGRAQAGYSVSPTDVIRLVGHEDAVVLDIRGEGEFASGHIVNAINLPESGLKAASARLEKYRSRPLIVVCGNGQRSAVVSADLRKQGFERALSLQGGLNAWKTAGLPLAKK